MRKIILFIFYIFCSACAVGPNYHKKEFFSEEKIADELGLNKNSQKFASIDWFKQFDDNYLNQLINTTLQNSPNIKIAKEKLTQARYGLYIANASLLPDLDLSGEYVKSSPAQTTFPAVKQDYFQVGFDASWEIDIWGGNRRLIESKQAMLKSAGADFDNVKLVLISEVVSNYINWQLYQKLVNETNKNIENQTKIYKAIKNKYDAGLVDELTLNQAESLLKSTKQKLPQFIINEKNTLNALAVLIGVLPSTIKKETSSILDKNFEFNTNVLYDLSAKIVQSRPDVYSSEQQLIAQNALIGNKISNLLPSLTLKTFLGFQNNTLSPIIGKDYNMYSNNFETIMPFFHWGKILNDIKTQESVTQEALENYKSVLLQAISDISASIIAVEQNIKNDILATENFMLYQNIANLSKIKYDTGLISFNDFLEAEQNKLSAQILKYQTTAKLLADIVSFYKAVGGGLNTSYNEPDDRKACLTKVCEPYKG